MRTPRRSGRRADRRRGRRGVVLLEFIFVLPLFIFLALFAVDMGRVMLAYGALSDSTYVAARAAAQAGSAASTAGDSQRAFLESISAVPGIDDPAGATLTIINGICSTSTPGRFIEMRGSKTFTFVTPGLGQLLNGFSNSQSSFGGSWQLSARAVVLCEIVR